MQNMPGLTGLGELTETLSAVLTPITVLVTIAACFAAAAVAAALVNPNVPASPFDYAYPSWGRWAWGVFVGGTLLGPLILGVLAFNFWGYLIAVALVFVVSLIGLIVLRAVARRS